MIALTLALLVEEQNTPSYNKNSSSVMAHSYTGVLKHVNHTYLKWLKQHFIVVKSTYQATHAIS